MFVDVLHNVGCFHQQTKLNSSAIKVYDPNVMNNNYDENWVVNSELTAICWKKLVASCSIFKDMMF